MRVFVTGATGFIGSAVVRELIDAGHRVVGLARSDKAAESLSAAGAEVHRGSLEDLDSLHKGAVAADGVIHLGFKTDFSDFAGAVAADLRAVETLGAALEGTGKPFVFTSGTLLVAWSTPPGLLGTEDVAVDSAVPRGAAENAVISLAERGVRASVVRLAPTVHGPGDHGFIPMLIDIARGKGFSAYVGDGSNRWPAVHRLDAARLYRLAVESAPAGSRLHGVGEEGVPFRDIAGIIGRRLNLPAISISREEAEAHFGFLGSFASSDNPMSSARTQERLGWHPAHPALIPDLEQGHYFNN
ncbi:SDR family oxidoreductase [Cohnella thailandensis]|uniref:SDR family oxidoreductase n=1 Tax=Cohnella thailandensis TaxID=557557 RepID=A0A841T9E7_9BACL|nr:SDR family oxidoreductase [Cohnella thailandensis]MBB6637831.1 SDR family oxidoreductase [Cohnella thailandensis]MBP1973989.1 nucleoside-diphosphate-sugar epimerase [Cohnella thailandensis]